MIDETLLKYAIELFEGWNNDKERISKRSKPHKEALTAIYEIGLEVIGEEEQVMWYGKMDEVALKKNDLRASQRKAWAKACGVAEK